MPVRMHTPTFIFDLIFVLVTGWALGTFTMVLAGLVLALYRVLSPTSIIDANRDRLEEITEHTARLSIPLLKKGTCHLLKETGRDIDE